MTFSALNDEQTMLALLVVLGIVWTVVFRIVKALEARSERHFEDMDNMRDSINYQKYIDAVPAAEHPMSFAAFIGSDDDENGGSGGSALPPAEDVLAVPTLTEVRTHRPIPNVPPTLPYRSRDSFPDAGIVRPIRDNPQA